MQNENKNQAKELWDYTFNLYAKDKVEASCLELQNSFSADVNVMLFLCWLVDQGKNPCSKLFLHSIIKTSVTWQREVVEPLRQLRKQIGAMQGLDAKTVKTSLLHSELEAEKSEQLALLDFVDSKNLEDQPSMSVAKKQEISRLSFMLYFEIISEGKGLNLNKAGKKLVDNIIIQAFKK